MSKTAPVAPAVTPIEDSLAGPPHSTSDVTIYHHGDLVRDLLRPHWDACHQQADCRGSLAIAPFRQREAEVAFMPAREGAEPREPEQIGNIGGAAFVAFEIAFGKLGTHFVHE